MANKHNKKQKPNYWLFVHRLLIMVIASGNLACIGVWVHNWGVVSETVSRFKFIKYNSHKLLEVSCRENIFLFFDPIYVNVYIYWLKAGPSSKEQNQC